MRNKWVHLNSKEILLINEIAGRYEYRNPPVVNVEVEATPHCVLVRLTTVAGVELGIESIPRNSIKITGASHGSSETIKR